MPPDSSMYASIVANLQYCGFEVISLIMEQKPFRYPSLRIRLQTKFYQHVLRQKDAKLRLKTQLFRQEHHDLLAQYPQIDYALFIRADVYHIDFLKEIKHKIKYTMINYQWDGMSRFPIIWDSLHLFDYCYVFDPNDLKQTHSVPLLPATNFYFDYNLQLDKPILYDFYFLGSHREDRVGFITQFCRYAEQMGWKLHFILLTNKKNVRSQYPVSNIQLTHQNMTLEENQAIAQQSRVLVDFVISSHQGLSLRVFEALGYRKKLITTNASVRHYDFYHPNNIYILDGQNYDGIQAFLDAPYQEIDPCIREKYSFSNWIKYILNIEPHQKITLPKFD